jgi:hypothetical protein
MKDNLDIYQTFAIEVEKLLKKHEMKPSQYMYFITISMISIFKSTDSSIEEAENFLNDILLLYKEEMKSKHD